MESRAFRCHITKSTRRQFTVTFPVRILPRLPFTLVFTLVACVGRRLCRRGVTLLLLLHLKNMSDIYFLTLFLPTLPLYVITSCCSKALNLGACNYYNSRKLPSHLRNHRLSIAFLTFAHQEKKPGYIFKADYTFDPCFRTPVGTGTILCPFSTTMETLDFINTLGLFRHRALKSFYGYK